MRPPEQRTLAQKLRRKGIPRKTIANRLMIPYSTICEWTRGVRITRNPHPLNEPVKWEMG